MSTSAALETFARLPIVALLEALELVQTRYGAEAVQTLAQGPWPQLHTLRLRRPLVPSYEYEYEGTPRPAPFDADDLLELLDGACAPALHTLELELVSNAEHLARALTRSSLTPQLRELKLGLEHFSPAFVDILRQAPFGALEYLRLSGPEVPTNAESLLRPLPGRLRLECTEPEPYWY